MYGDTLPCTIDGAVWYSIAHQAILAIPMWIGMQGKCQAEQRKERGMGHQRNAGFIEDRHRLGGALLLLGLSCP